LRRAIDKFERDWNYDASYMRDMIDASPRAAWLFSRVTALGRFRRDLPIEAWCACNVVERGRPPGPFATNRDVVPRLQDIRSSGKTHVTKEAHEVSRSGILRDRGHNRTALSRIGQPRGSRRDRRGLSERHCGSCDSCRPPNPSIKRAYSRVARRKRRRMVQRQDVSWDLAFGGAVCSLTHERKVGLRHQVISALMTTATATSRGNTDRVGGDDVRFCENVLRIDFTGRAPTHVEPQQQTKGR